MSYKEQDMILNYLKMEKTLDQMDSTVNLLCNNIQKIKVPGSYWITDKEWMI